MSLTPVLPNRQSNPPLSLKEPLSSSLSFSRIVRAICHLGADAILSLLRRIREIAIQLFPCLNCTKQYDPKKWLTRSISCEKAETKMIKNLGKAYDEQYLLWKSDYGRNAINPFAKKRELNQDLISAPISLNDIIAVEAQHIGHRHHQEDLSFTQKTSEGVLFGVFDGHSTNWGSGREVAELASQTFQIRFWQLLEENSHNVFKAFELVFQEIQNEAGGNLLWNLAGCTAVICFIDPTSNRVYTSTVGDSKAFLITSSKELHPLSCVRDWSFPKEAGRLANYLQKPEIAIEWPRTKQSKSLRHPITNLNLSRSLGDSSSTPAVTHKPKTTMCPLFKNEFILIASDGLTDVLTLEEILSPFKNGVDSAKIPEELINQTLLSPIGKNKKDNTTVLLVKIN